MSKRPRNDDTRLRRDAMSRLSEALLDHLAKPADTEDEDREQEDPR